jgi:transcriptional regulator with XRE-family HTH domain
VPRFKKSITYSHAPLAAVQEAVGRLGSNIEAARLRRRWTQQDLAGKAGITRSTLVAIEHGKPGTGVGAYVAVLWALGLHGDVALIASPERDEEGRTLEAARLPQRARAPSGLDDDF